MKIKGMSWVVVHGDFSEGFQFMGPFETQEEAQAWIKKIGDWSLPVFTTNMMSPEWVDEWVESEVKDESQTDGA